jgi:hypothetical protein
MAGGALLVEDPVAAVAIPDFGVPFVSSPAQAGDLVLKGGANWPMPSGKINHNLHERCSRVFTQIAKAEQAATSANDPKQPLAFA